MEKSDIFEKRAAELIRKVRIEKNLKQSQLANLVGISAQTISNFERGASTVNLKTFINIMLALDYEDTLNAIFPKDYTSPLLEIKKEKLEVAAKKMRVSRKSKKAQEIKTSNKVNNKMDRRPFDSLLAKPTKKDDE